VSETAAHFPGRAALEAYGNGGFRFAGMSHRGSILCLPSGIWSWPVATAAEIDADTLAPVIAERDDFAFVLIGTGPDLVPLPPPLRDRLRAAGVRAEVMSTGAAARTYNVLLAEDRNVAAALIAVA
jgi:uncharacterized protein